MAVAEWSGVLPFQSKVSAVHFIRAVNAVHPSTDECLGVRTGFTSIGFFPETAKSAHLVYDWKKPYFQVALCNEEESFEEKRVLGEMVDDGLVKEN